jgi:hypothetical protein
VRAATVHGEMPSDDRARVLRDFAEGRMQVLTNVAVLTEGFDDPGVSCVAMARPTRSEGMYAQCVGRGTRPRRASATAWCWTSWTCRSSACARCRRSSGCRGSSTWRAEEVGEAERFFEQLAFDHPAFEVEAGAITLGEIQARAEAFDPLTQEVDVEVRAISRNAWASLGRHGLALHFERAPGRLQRGAGGARAGRAGGAGR